MKCDGCSKSTGFRAWKEGDQEREYCFSCANCMRTYCDVCLKDEPTYNADGEYDTERGAVDCSSMPTCRWCNDREGHIDDCPVWCGEPCKCAARFDPDAIADRVEGI